MRHPEKKYKILIVEDERAMAYALQLKFTKEGFNVTLAGNGEEAYEYLTSTDFDILLLDLVLPRLDGFGLLHKLRFSDLSIPVIIISNLSQREDIKRSQDLGVKEFIVKSDTEVSGIVDIVRDYLKLEFEQQRSDSPQ